VVVVVVLVVFVGDRGADLVCRACINRAQSRTQPMRHAPGSGELREVGRDMT
jgi:hypothetical protein